jgi:hypothetical protein
VSRVEMKMKSREMASRDGKENESEMTAEERRGWGAVRTVLQR